MKKNKRLFFNKSGFTLVEFLVVIFIIAALTSVILVSLSKSRMKARDNRRKSDLAVIQQSVEMYYSDKHSFPLLGQNGCIDTKSTQFITAIKEYLPSIPEDPSGLPNYCYASSGNPAVHYIILSNIENKDDSDYDKSLTQIWQGKISGYKSTYHYYVSSD